MNYTETYFDLFQYNNLDIKKGTFLIHGKGPNQLNYVIIDDEAIFQGDIIIGDVTDIEKKQSLTLNSTEAALGVVGRLWEDYAKIPYKIDCIVNQDRIRNAIKLINDNTNVNFVEKGDGDINYITIKNDCTGIGASYVGCKGGEQIVHLNREGNFKVGNVIHELCHALGLWHEHSRQDRDTMVEIEIDNIDPIHQHNFDKLTSSNEKDFGLYDYNSIMHYSQYAFTINREENKRTILCKNPYYQDKIGQRNSLSQGDISGINALVNHI